MEGQINIVDRVWVWGLVEMYLNSNQATYNCVVLDDLLKFSESIILRFSRELNGTVSINCCKVPYIVWIHLLLLLLMII